MNRDVVFLDALLTVILFYSLMITIPSVRGQWRQHYVGCYFDQTCLSTTKVYMRTTFCESSPPPPWISQSIMSVLSIAGHEDDNVPSAYLYQILALLDSENYVLVSPQINYNASVVWWEQSVYRRMDYTWLEIEMVMCAQDTGKPRFYYVAYKDDVHYIKDKFIKETWNANYTTGDTDFLVGRDYHDSRLYKFFQFGIESPDEASTRWAVNQYWMSYYSNNAWRFCSAKSVQGDKSHITYKPQEGIMIGGLVFHHVNVSRVDAPDAIVWGRTGHTQEDGRSIWTGSGTVPGPRH